MQQVSFTPEQQMLCWPPNHVLSCPLQVFKLSFLSPYLTQCLQLASDKSLREGIVGFPLALGADGSMLPEHRPGGWLLGGWLCHEVVSADAAARLASFLFTPLQYHTPLRSLQATGKCSGSPHIQRLSSAAKS